jgi:predicted phosphodiesterase
MKIHLLSDLHVEARLTKYRAVEADITVIAGDLLGKWWDQPFVDFIEAYLAGIPRPTYIVLGNHDFYGPTMSITDRYDIPAGPEFALNAILARHPHVHLLHNTVEHVVVGDRTYCLAGTPLWSDFQLDETQNTSAMLAGRLIGDFVGMIQVIKGDGSRRLWTTDDHVKANAKARVFLEDALATEVDVVVTHWLPTPDAIAPRYEGDPLNPYFVSDCEHLIAKYSPRLWLFGHTHTSYDGQVGDTRCVCNPRGYNKRENPSYDPELVITVD